jgi:hypothetical protein
MSDARLIFVKKSRISALNANCVQIGHATRWLTKQDRRGARKAHKGRAGMFRTKTAPIPWAGP